MRALPPISDARLIHVALSWVLADKSRALVDGVGAVLEQRAGDVAREARFSGEAPEGFDLAASTTDACRGMLTAALQAAVVEVETGRLSMTDCCPRVATAAALRLFALDPVAALGTLRNGGLACTDGFVPWSSETWSKAALALAERMEASR